jgi:hypothetical protein
LVGQLSAQQWFLSTCITWWESNPHRKLERAEKISASSWKLGLPLFSARSWLTQSTITVMVVLEVILPVAASVPVTVAV